MLNELSGEMAECSVYYLASSQCFKDFPDPRAAELNQNNKSAAESMGDTALEVGRSVGLTDEAYVARLKLISESMLRLMNNNCGNVSVLLERYADFCKRLAEAPDDRLHELIAGKICNGSYRCN